MNVLTHYCCSCCGEGHLEEKGGEGWTNHDALIVYEPATKAHKPCGARYLSLYFKAC